MWGHVGSAGVAFGAVVIMSVGAACSDGDQATPATLPMSEAPTSADHTGPADELAPSQVTASTVAAPTTPGPCDLADLELWTSRVSVGEGSADAVIAVSNVGETWCEVDIGGSILLDEAIEPNVWLDPGASADLVVGQSGQECVAPTLITSADFHVNGDAVIVPTAAVASCGWRLTAFYPNDQATEPCDRPTTVAVDAFVLIRNDGVAPCVLGELTAADGLGAMTTPRPATDALSVSDLAAGDVVAIPFSVSASVDCDAATGPGSITFDVAGPVPVEMVPCGAVYQLGAARPWFSDPNGPLADFDPESFDLTAALAALDPFN